MEYNRVNWKDFPDTSTKMSAENFNKMDEGIAEAAEEINANKEKIDELSSQLVASDNFKFRFATDGEGSYGYLGADDSFIPFKSGLEIATGTFTPGKESEYTIIKTGFKPQFIITTVLHANVKSLVFIADFVNQKGYRAYGSQLLEIPSIISKTIIPTDDGFKYNCEDLNYKYLTTWWAIK